MEMYDEDLTANNFFKKLQVDSPVLYDVATRRRWLICIPRRGALGACEFSDTDFENHILFQEEGQADSQYFTVNKKELLIKNNVITTKTGFKEERVVPILFEETFFNKNDEGYLVLCINQPLEGNSAYGVENNTQEGQIILHHITDCADLLFRKQGNKKVGASLDDHMRGFLQSFASHESHVLDTLLKDTMTFYAKGLQIVMKDHVLKKRSQEEDGFYLTLKVALESFLMHNVYRHLFIHVGTCVALKDARLNKITRNLRELQLRDLDVRTEFCQNVPKARRELSNLSRYFTPLGKLICLKRVFRVLMQGGSATPTEDSHHMSTDDLLPMVIFLIIKADEEHWWAIFTYITMFRFSKQNSDNEYGFFLATVEAALEHIASNQIHKYLLSRKVRELSVSYSSPSPALQETLWRQQEVAKSHLDSFFQCVFVGDLAGVREFLSQEPSPVTDTSALCHPLCECESCAKLLLQKQQEKEQMKVSLDSYDDRGWTALHLAAWCGHVDIVDWLVQSGVDINIKDVQGHTPLHVACMAGQQSSTLLVLHLQADPNTQDNENNTPLHLASLHGHEDCVKALAYYDQGNTALDTEITNDFGDTALHFASRWGYYSICQILLENGAEVLPRNRKNLTPVEVSHNLIVMRLLQSRLRPNPNAPVVLKPQARNLTYQKQRRRSSESKSTISPPKMTAATSDAGKGKVLAKEKLSNPKIEKLLTAVLNRDLPLVEFYMGWAEDGEIVEIPSSSPVTEESLCHPLCQCDKCAPVQQLRSPVGKDIHINSQNAEGMSPLHVAAQCGYLEICRLFMQRGALVNLSTNTQGYTPLHLAVKNQRQEVVSFFLRQKCELDLPDARGNTALHHAAICGMDSILTALLDFGAQKNVQNAKGNTGLHESCTAGHVTCVRVLLEYGAVVHLKNGKGLTALQLSRNEQVRSLFRYSSVDSLTSGRVFQDSRGLAAPRSQNVPPSNPPSTSTNPGHQKIQGNVTVKTDETSSTKGSIQSVVNTTEQTTKNSEVVDYIGNTIQGIANLDSEHPSILTENLTPKESGSKPEISVKKNDGLSKGESHSKLPGTHEESETIKRSAKCEDYFLTHDMRRESITPTFEDVDSSGLNHSHSAKNTDYKVEIVNKELRTLHDSGVTEPHRKYSVNVSKDKLQCSHISSKYNPENTTSTITTTNETRTEAGGGQITDTSHKTDGAQTTDQWTFIPLNEPSEQWARVTDCSMAEHTDKQPECSHSDTEQGHAEACRSCLQKQNRQRLEGRDGEMGWGVVVSDTDDTRTKSPEEVTSLHSATESLGALSFKDEYFANSVESIDGHKDYDIEDCHKNTSEKWVECKEVDVVDIAGQMKSEQEIYQSQSLFTVEASIIPENPPSEGEGGEEGGFVFTETVTKSAHCDSLSEDSRTESEKDLTGE